MKKLLPKFIIVAVFFTVVFTFSGMAYASTIRVGLVRSFENRTSINISSTSIEVGRGRVDGTFEYSRTLTSAGGFVVQVDGGQVVVRAGNQAVFTFLNDAVGGRQIRATNGILAMEGASYRGAIEFSLSGGRISAINVICIEEYLYGVLPVEMSPSFNTEALRAQAVAARTFAMYTIGSNRHPSGNFDICDTTHCQGYHGAGREYDVTTQAVRDTSGLIIFALGGNSPLFTPYFSSSGGATDNSENVWFDALPHLRGVVDYYETVARTWTRTYTWAQLTNAVRAEAPSANIGTVTGVSITREHLGRVQELTFYGTNGNWSTTGQRTMTIFRHISGSLDSRNYYIVGAAGGAGIAVHVTDGFIANQDAVTNMFVVGANGNVVQVSHAHVFNGQTTRRLTENVLATGGTGITINGRGWGHGVGMSQNGANGMAAAGYTFWEILMHYYTGIEIRTL